MLVMFVRFGGSVVHGRAGLEFGYNRLDGISEPAAIIWRIVSQL